MPFGIVEALVIVPPSALLYGYNRLLRELKEARHSDDASPNAIVQRTEMTARVTREGWLVFGGIVINLGLLSIIP